MTSKLSPDSQTEQLALEPGLNPLDQLVERMKAIDPTGYAHPKMTQRKARVAAIMQENLLRMWKDNKLACHMNKDAQDLFRKQGMLYSQRMEAQGRKFVATTTTDSIATIATQILPIITRAIAENPIFDLVDSLPMTSGPEANIVYFDTLFDSSGGLYSNGQRVDQSEDPSYSDRTDCEAEAVLLRASVTSETAAATEKVTGFRMCVTAMQNAETQYGMQLDEMMTEQIAMQQSREWGRLVSDDLRTMAGNTTSYAKTPPSPYSSLNTNEYRKVLAETMITLDATIRTAIHEPTEWALSDLVTAAILERIVDPHLRVSAQNAGPGELGLAPQNANDRPFLGRWDYRTDAFFPTDTILMGRRSFRLVPNSPYYFLPFIFGEAASFIFYPLTQVLEGAIQSRAARKMIEPLAYGRIDLT